MPSELQRVAQSLLAALEEITRIVPYLHDQSRKYREAADWVGGLSRSAHSQAAAMQLDEAARRCEEAAHLLALAPPKARAWAEQMVSGERTIEQRGTGSAAEPDAADPAKPTLGQQDGGDRQPRAEREGTSDVPGGPASPEEEAPDQSDATRTRRVTADDVREILGRLPVRDERKQTPDKTRGLWVDGQGNEEELVSGYDRYSSAADEYIAQEKVGPPPHSLRIASHVEVKFAMMMRERGLTDETIVINNVPCRRPWGCNILLPYLLPKGASLTVYDQDGFGKTYRGRGKP